MSPELRQRFTFGPLFAGIFIGAIVVDLTFGVPYAVLGLLTITAIAASLEFARLVRPIAPGVQRVSLAVMSLLLVLSPWIMHGGLITLSEPIPYQGLLLGLGFVWIGLRQFQRYGTDNFTRNVGTTTLGLCYVGLLPSMVAALLILGDEQSPGRGHLLFLLLVATVKMGDVAAFAGGKNFGRHKMAPSISPGKTWEGFAASFVGAIGGAYAFVFLATLFGADNPFSGWWQPAVWGLVLGPIGVLGDLWESGIKRDLAVKDSGNSIPGFGGILDILDAIILAAPIAYILARFLP